jgi:hypothetical protein
MAVGAAELKTRFPPAQRSRGAWASTADREAQMRDHNGRVDIDSNPHGTSVSVLLPVLENGA